MPKKGIFKEILKIVSAVTPHRRLTTCFRVTLLAVTLLLFTGVTITYRSQNDVFIKRLTILENVVRIEQLQGSRL